MLIKVKSTSAATEQQVTDEAIYHSRRTLLKQLGWVGAGSIIGSQALFSTSASANLFDWFDTKQPTTQFQRNPLQFTPEKPQPKTTLTTEEKIISYNNFYEFGTQKTDPKEYGQQFTVNPWQLTISGAVQRPITLDYTDLLSSFPLEERIYRLRCVEAWSMVVPWVGFPLASLLKRVDVTSKGKFVKFTTLYDPQQLRGQTNRFLGGGIDYPYVEGLRIDEAMHPLTLLAVGLYGKTLAPQNGAPIRLVVPWKYGFKSIKSIVKIELTQQQPINTWQKLIPKEYGFYANVNPDVPHPRWSQATERVITSGGLLSRNRIATQLFNGYHEVAGLYSQLDLKKHY